MHHKEEMSAEVKKCVRFPQVSKLGLSGQSEKTTHPSLLFLIVPVVRPNYRYYYRYVGNCSEYSNDWIWEDGWNILKAS